MLGELTRSGKRFLLLVVVVLCKKKFKDLLSQMRYFPFVRYCIDITEEFYAENLIIKKRTKVKLDCNSSIQLI